MTTNDKERIAALLIELGFIQAGDPIILVTPTTIIYPNKLDQYAALLTCLFHGLVETRGEKEACNFWAEVMKVWSLNKLRVASDNEQTNNQA